MRLRFFMRVLIIAAGIVMCSAPAAAQQEVLAGVRDRLDPATFRTLTALTDSALAAGLPTDPIVSKVQEGLLKRAAPNAIVVAARSLVVRLRQSRDVLGASASAAEVEAGASALRAGAAPALLAELRATRGSRGLAVPLVVLADLLARGVPRATAARTMQTMAAANATDAAFQALRLNIERDITGGMSPAAAAGQRYRALLERHP